MENIQLTLADMASIKTIIEAAVSRGAYQANELSTVGGIYDKLSAFIENTQAHLAAQPAEAQPPVEPVQSQGE